MSYDDGSELRTEFDRMAWELTAEQESYRSRDVHAEIESQFVRSWTVTCEDCEYEYRARNPSVAVLHCKHHEDEHSKAANRHDCEFYPVEWS